MRILQVDYMGCLYWYYHAKEGNPTWKLLKRLRDIIEQFRIDRTLLLLEGGSDYRLKLHPGYKGERKKRNAEQPEAEKQRHAAFMEQATKFSRSTAPLFGIIPVRVKGAEADDLAGYLCNHIDTTKHQILNLSGDQDWYQLLRKNVVQGSYKDIQEGEGIISPKVWLSESGFVRKYGIPVDQWIWKKCLTGDTGDSVAGFSQLGDKTALLLLQKYGSIDEIEKNKTVLDVPRMKSEAKQGIARNFDLVYTNYQLMNLNHCPEVERDMFGEQGVEYLENLVGTLDQPNRVNVEQLTEIAYERGWLEIDEQWLAPFCR